MSAPLHVLLPSDVFPPRCGGAGWSAHALARALIGRGHCVTALVPQRVARGRPTGAAPALEDVQGVPTLRFAYRAPRIPFVQNYARFERLWPLLAAELLQLAQAAPSPPIIHAQHVQAAPAAVLAGRRLGAPVVITVRDHWPWDYFNTGLHGDRLPYAQQTWASAATNLPARLGPLRGALALPALPYMLAHVRRRQQALRQADAVIAVSGYMAGRLRALVPAERLHVIPNMADLAAIEAALATPPASVPPGARYLLFVGKLEPNKGAQLLSEIFRALRALGDGGPELGVGAGLPPGSQPTPLNSLELVIAGDGPLRATLDRELAVLGVRVRLLDWVDHDEVLRLMAGCELLLFPSAWGEPLSRVLLEAGACGAAVLAMPTGGTPDIIADGVSGALEATVPGFARRLAALLASPATCRRLGHGARQAVAARFSEASVVPQVEALYRSLARV